NRAFSDPAGLEQLLGGAFSTWVEARDGYYVMPLTTMADNYTASWNNASIRFYTSVGSDCPVRCGWTNSSTAAEAAGGPAVAAQWYGYYTVLSSANDVLAAIKNGICFDDDCAADSTLTQRDKTMAKMLQGMALAGISLIYDQGFVVDETTVLPLDPTAYPPIVTRTAMRDAALQKFEEAYTAAGVEKWSTEADWMGLDGWTAYTNTQIRRLIRTMEAELIAMWPRNSTENGAADWAKVANYGSQGISADTGTAVFDWKFSIDASARDAGIEWVKSWGNSIGTMRVDTRVAKMVDPLSQEDPWPLKNPLTRVTAAITGSGSLQTVTPLAMPTSLTNGRLLAIECAPFDVSCVGDRFVVSGVTATTFDAVITKSYPGPTTLSAAVTHDTLADGSAKKVAATPVSMSGITKGAFLWVDDDTTRNEALTVDSVTATTYYAKFLKNHPSGVAVAPAIHRNGGSPGNWCPLTSPDKRVGDGSYGPSDDFNGYATLKKTANSGTDYACSGVAIFPPARGQYHQSNLQHVRYQYLGGVGEILPGFDGTGQDPFYTRQMNDLLWAEGLIRDGGGGRVHRETVRDRWEQIRATRLSRFSKPF